MANLFALKQKELQRLLTKVPNLGAAVFLSLSLTFGLMVIASRVQASEIAVGQCQRAFAPSLVKMNPLYIGENEGKYFDSITNTFWKVQYFTPSEKRAFELVIREGKVFHLLDGQKAQSLFDPDAMSWENSLFVVDKDQRLFLLPFEERGRFHHSSLSGGKDILFAGTAAFHQGVIREISDRSGHYKPTKEQTLLVLKELAGKGLDISQLRLTGHFIKEHTNHPSLSSKDVQIVFPELFE